MNERFQNKYRIPSARLKSWNYANPGLYFITICTARHIHFFGKITAAVLQPSEIGQVVEMEWLKTPECRPDMHLALGEYVVMPNHFHAILMIGWNDFNSEQGLVAGSNSFGPQKKNLASVIRGFKSAVTTFARKNDLSFEWQARFHDHIIRDEGAYQRISQYILNNPANWENDRFFGP
ncbi:MAG: hypothetical protein JNK89_01765 [Saprospiraceae bacterium]|nr:hypothetical protein [Saprospiraceae bacterium]